jgi:hypothetical protein
VLDRESSFADEKVIDLLRRSFVPVALDVWYEERRQDAGGDFYRKVVFQRDGMVADRTTQGFYIFSPDGALIRGWNNRDVGKLREALRRAADDYRPPKSGALDAKPDSNFARTPPPGGLVVDVHSRILKGEWPEASDDWQKIFRSATGRDHLWITKQEVDALARGDFPKSLATRIARYHCIDNTRGEPPMWERPEVSNLRMDCRPAKSGFSIEGEVRLATAAGERGYDARATGVVEAKGDRVTRFDLVVRGDFFGEGTFTKGAPKGKFTLAIAFTLAEESPARAEIRKVPPQGARDLGDYLGRE